MRTPAVVVPVAATVAAVPVVVVVLLPTVMAVTGAMPAAPVRTVPAVLRSDRAVRRATVRIREPAEELAHIMQIPVVPEAVAVDCTAHRI